MAALPAAGLEITVLERTSFGARVVSEATIALALTAYTFRWSSEPTIGPAFLIFYDY